MSATETISGPVESHPQCKRCQEAETRSWYYRQLAERRERCDGSECQGTKEGWIVGKMCRVHVIDPWNGGKVTEVEAFWGGANYWFTPDGKKFRSKYVRVLD